MRKRRVVVTGIGPFSAAGIGKDAVWDSILKRDTGLVRHEHIVGGEIWDSFWVHKIKDFDIRNLSVAKEKLEEIGDRIRPDSEENRDFYFLVAAIKLALDDSRIEYSHNDNRVGLFLTVEHPGFEPFCSKLIEEAVAYFQGNINERGFSKIDMFKNIFSRLVDKGYDIQTFMYLYYIARIFDFHGYSLFTSNACASGLYAFEAAAKQIKYGGSDIAVVAGGDSSCTMFKHIWFKERGIYAEDGKSKPFSAKADGIVLGDGASAIVLEEFEHASKRGAHIYAEYLGGGFHLEGWKITIPNMISDSYSLALQEALEISGVNVSNVDLVNPHGVGIKVTDVYEARAIEKVFGNKSPYVSALKPYVGHNLGGSALMEMAILLLCMEKGHIPALLNCEERNPEVKLNLVKENMNCPVNIAVKISCGFAGYNGAVVLSRI